MQRQTAVDGIGGEQSAEVVRGEVHRSTGIGEPGDRGEVDQNLAHVVPSQHFVTGTQRACEQVRERFAVDLVVGGLVRSALQAVPYAVIYEEMKHPDALLDLCDGIYTIRRESYRGHRIDEVFLYNVLLNLMRSPEVLLRITKRRLENL